MSSRPTTTIAIMATAPDVAMMTADDPIAIGDVVPDVPLQTFDGRELRLPSLRGHPLLIVCVRYYG